MLSPTAVAAGVLAVLFALLGTRISLARMARRTDDEGFGRLRRVHANAAEHLPILLVLLFLAEWRGVPRSLLVAGAALVVAARVAHAVGYSLRQTHPLQRLGATLTYVAEAGLGVLLLVYGL